MAAEEKGTAKKHKGKGGVSSKANQQGTLVAGEEPVSTLHSVFDLTVEERQDLLHLSNSLVAKFGSLVATWQC